MIFGKVNVSWYEWVSYICCKNKLKEAPVDIWYKHFL